MLRTIKIFLLMTALISTLVSSQTLLAQTITYKPLRPLHHQALMLAYYNVDFFYARNESVTVRDFSSQVIALNFTFLDRPENIKLLIGFGNRPGSKNTILLDAELRFWYNVPLSELRRSRFSLIIPLLLSYRRLHISAQSNTNKNVLKIETLSIVKLGTGLGVELDSRLGSRITLESRTTLIITPIENRSKTIIRDNILEADMQVHWEQLFSARYGLTVGLEFRGHRWLIFKGTELGGRLGVHW